MKQLSLGFLLAILLFACKKEPESNGNNNSVQNPVGDPPQNFSKKVLIEVFKGEWNPNCPTGDDTLKAMMALDTNIIGACIHQGDWLAITPFFTQISSHLGGVNGYPRAAINRIPASEGTQIDSTVYSIFNWRLNIDAILQTQSVPYGLAISSKEKNDLLDLKVYVAYQDSVLKRTRLTVYLIEDSVEAQNQVNVTPPYIHHNVLRQVISENLGDSLALLDGKMITTNYSVNLSGLYKKKANLRIIAFINIMGDDAKQNEILNVQQAKLNEVKKWD